MTYLNVILTVTVLIEVWLIMLYRRINHRLRRLEHRSTTPNRDTVGGVY